MPDNPKQRSSPRPQRARRKTEKRHFVSSSLRVLGVLCGECCFGSRWTWSVLVGVGAILAISSPAMAMHVSEGILPAPWCGLWFVVSAPFLLWGLLAVRRRRAIQSSYMPMLAMIGAAVFLISCMPIPVPVAGSCSHPCGTGLAAILVGPGPSIVVATIALLFQALFMSHGGLTTLGANVFTMGVLGSLTGWAAFKVVRRVTGSFLVGAFVAGLLSDWATYAGTSFILASGLHDGGLGHASVPMWNMFLATAVLFMPTQIPLGVLEGVLTAGAYAFIVRRRPELIGSPLSQTQGARQ